MASKFPPPRMIAIDVDKTLYFAGELNDLIVRWAKEKRADGFELIVWSNRGTKYAQAAAQSAGLVDLCSACISKPGYILDDKGWDWIRHTVWVRRDAISGRSNGD